MAISILHSAALLLLSAPLRSATGALVTSDTDVYISRRLQFQVIPKVFSSTLKQHGANAVHCRAGNRFVE